jgi:hypothetical protein
VRQTTTHVSDPKQGSGAARCLRSQSSTTASSPALTSTRDDPYDLTHRLHHLAGPLIDASDDGGGHGGLKERDGSGTPAMTSVAQPNARTSIYEQWRT